MVLASSLVIFYSVVAIEALERLFELVLSKRNSRRVIARGGVVLDHPIHRVVAISHVIWLVAVPLEVFLFNREFNPFVASVCLVILGLAMVLRYWAVLTLGDRWNIRIITEPGKKRITGGPYRCFRHPNYVAVYAEYFALPLLHSAWFSAFVLGTIGSIVIAAKTKIEDEAILNSSTESSEAGAIS
jgi:methyltransferase